jgi:hypothetical protein
MSSVQGELLNEGKPLVVKAGSYTYSVDADGRWPDWKAGDPVYLSSDSGSVELLNKRSSKTVRGWVTKK